MVKCTENTALDHVGNEFCVGDEVVICRKNSKTLTTALVLEIDNCCALVEYKDKFPNRKVTKKVTHENCVVLY